MTIQYQNPTNPSLTLDSTIVAGNYREILVLGDPTSANTAKVTAAGALTVDASATVQPVSIAATLNNNIVEWGSQAVAAATNTAPVGSEYAPVFRSLDFKSSQTIYNGLVPSGTSYSSWQDSQATGAIYAATTGLVSVPTPTIVQYGSSEATSITLGSNVTAGDILLLYATQSISAPTDTQGNTWTLIASTPYYTTKVWYATASATGSITVTLNNTSGYSAILIEIAGANNLDVYAVGYGYGTAAASGTTGTTKYPIEIVINFFLSAASSFTESAGDGATQITSQVGGSGTTAYASYKVTSSIGTQSSQGTLSSSQYWGAYCIAFYSSANAITGTSIGLQETDDTSNALMMTTFATTLVTSAAAPFTAQGTITKRYYRSFFTNGAGSVNLEQTLTSSSGTPELLDLNGNQKFIFGSQFQAGVTWNSTTSLNSTQTLVSGSGVPCIVVQLNQSSGTFSAGAVTFQGTRDGSNWETIPGDVIFNPHSLAAISNPYTLVTNTTQAFLIQTTGYVAIQVVLTTAIQGTGTVTPYINTVSYDPLPLNSGIYQSTLPSLTNGQASALQLDNNGGLRIASPNAFHSMQATSSGSTAVWSPASGKKFRLQQFRVQVTANATLGAAGVLTVELLDSATNLNITHDIYLPTSGTTNSYDSGWVNLGSGLQSAAANNVLNVNLSAALTSGNVRVTAGGIEE